MIVANFSVDGVGFFAFFLERVLFIPVAVCRCGGGGMCVTRPSVFKEFLHGCIYSLLLFLQ